MVAMPAMRRWLQLSTCRYLTEAVAYGPGRKNRVEKRPGKDDFRG